MPSEEPEDEGAAGPPPHPLDRPWVHPTEMFARTSSGGRSHVRGPRSRGRDIAVAVGAGVVGALAMVAILGLAGLLGGSHDEGSSSSTAQPNDTDAAERIAAVASHSVVGILVATPLGDRRASGVVVAPGNVITTTAALAGATSMRVLPSSGSARPATVLGRDDTTGLVVLRFDSQGTSPADLGSDDKVRSGTWIVAIGGGAGGGPFVTSGVVSSLGGWSDDGTGIKKPGLIATNTSMPAEARGGALLDSEGRLVGLLVGPARGSTGALAMPSDMARSVLEQLADSGHVEHGELGIRAADTDAGPGVEVAGVVEGGPADKQGVRVGDIIVGIDDKRVPDSATLVYEVRRRRSGDQVTLVATRNAKRKTFQVTLGRYEPQGTAATASTARTAVAASP